MKRKTTALVFVLLALATASFASGWVGKTAPDFTATSATGEAISLTGMKGDKVVWINFWGLRCGPCVRELPALEDIYQRYKDQGLIILGVNADGVDGEFILNSFKDREDLAAIKISFPLVPDTEFGIMDSYELMGAPLNVIIDRDGVVQYYHEGYEAGDEAKYEEVVKQLVAK